MTHTFVVLQVSEAAWEEIERKLDAAGYDHAFSRDDEYGVLIDMHGIALAKEAALPEHLPGEMPE